MNVPTCDFLLVAALPKEFIPAVYKVFDANRIPKNLGDARNYYQATQRTESGGQYVLRLLCVGRQGGQNTASVVTQAVLKWCPRYVVMFGIAAARPGGKRKLGDILISEWIADFEETKRSSSEKPRPFLWPCERQLFSHLEELKEQSTKTLHVGCIISQPNLSRKASYRDALVGHVTAFLNRDTVIGLEMEGGGLAKALFNLSSDRRPGFMLIKGAVDWGNYHKIDAIQQKTAVEVARFVKEFLASEPVAVRMEVWPRYSTDLPCRLLAKSELNSNGVSLANERHVENGRFRVWATFYLTVGNCDLELMSLWVGYYAQGCLCLGVAGSISVGSETARSIFGHLDLNDPLKLNAETTYTVKYSGSQQPPLMQQTPDSINGEHGDMVIEAKCRLVGEYDFRSVRWVFRFAPGRDPEAVEEVREPPRLSDRELHAWRATGKLSEEQYQQLLVLRPRERYLASIARRESGVTADISRGTLELLRILYRAGPPDSLVSV